MAGTGAECQGWSRGIMSKGQGLGQVHRGWDRETRTEGQGLEQRDRGMGRKDGRRDRSREVNVGAEGQGHESKKEQGRALGC